MGHLQRAATRHPDALLHLATVAAAAEPAVVPTPRSAPMPPAPRGWQKSKLDAATLDALALGTMRSPSGRVVKIRVSQITLETGERLWMTNLVHKGGFGTVHYGIRENGELVAVKKFRFDAKLDANGKPIKTKRTVWREYTKERDIARRFGALRSGEIGRKGYFVQALGRDLNAGLKRVPFLQRCDMLRSAIMQMATSLQNIHNEGYVHCDVKLHNALVYPGGIVKVADMGLAQKLQADGMVPQGRVGTPGYIAPEIVTGRRYGTRVDTWSLAVAWATGLAGLKMTFFLEEKPDAAEKSYEAWLVSRCIGDAADGGIPNTSRILSADDPASTMWDRYFSCLLEGNPERAKRLLTGKLTPKELVNILQEQKLYDFEVWRWSLQGPDGQVDLNRIKRPGAPGATEADGFFYKLSLGDRGGCALMLNRMFRWAPADRADVMEVAEAIARSSRLNLEAMAAEWNAIDRHDTSRQAAFNALSRVREEVLLGRLIFP